jgi:hypothetical protein
MVQAREGPKLPTSPGALFALSPVLKLPRPLELFGREFKVRTSTGLTFSPDTAARAVLDMSMDTAMRTYLPRHYQVMKKLLYAAAGRHAPSGTTRKLIAREFASVFPAHQLQLLLDGEPVPDAYGPTSDWAAVLRGMQGSEGVFVDVASCLAACDEQTFYVRALTQAGRREEAEAYVGQLLRPDVAAWTSLNPALTPEVLVLVEIALKCLAWLECRLEPPPSGRDKERSSVDALLDLPQRPMGNWLSEVCEASGCKNLGQLSTKLQFRSKYLGRPIAHDRLRSWSSPRRGLMPRAAVKPLLVAVRLPERVLPLESRYYVARLFTFLSDLLRAGTRGAPPPWEEVQAHLRSRFADTYRLQVGHACTRTKREGS